MLLALLSNWRSILICEIISVHDCIVSWTVISAQFKLQICIVSVQKVLLIFCNFLYYN